VKGGTNTSQLPPATRLPSRRLSRSANTGTGRIDALEKVPELIEYLTRLAKSSLAAIEKAKKLVHEVETDPRSVKSDPAPHRARPGFVFHAARFRNDLSSRRTSLTSRGERQGSTRHYLNWGLSG
jgi:hypothetical protein